MHQTAKVLDLVYHPCLNIQSLNRKFCKLDLLFPSLDVRVERHPLSLAWSVELFSIHMCICMCVYTHMCCDSDYIKILLVNSFFFVLKSCVVWLSELTEFVSQFQQFIQTELLDLRRIMTSWTMNSNRNLFYIWIHMCGQVTISL